MESNFGLDSVSLYMKILQMKLYAVQQMHNPENSAPSFDPSDPEYYCSPGFQNLKKVNGFQTLLDHMSSLKDAPVVSVGSGSGYVEKQCLEKIPDLKMILIDPLDPANNEFCPVPEHLSQKPSYRSVQDLIDAKPEIISNCHLFLNWTPPNDKYFDYESIVMLEPHKIIICCEVSGSAGSKKLLAWLNYCGVDATDLFTHETAEDMNITGPLYSVDDSISVDSRCQLGWPTRFMLLKLCRNY